MEEGEEDCIVREVPVVFTRSHTGLHYLLQYPLRPAWHDIVGSSVSSCKFKPIQQQLKIVVGTNVASPNIDLDHATFPQVEQSFNSVQVPSSASYFAGFWSGSQDNELLQLVPLSGVLQMRPDFKYIDESAQAQLRLNAEQDKAEEQETIDISDGDDGNDDPVYVQVVIKKRESDRAKRMRQQSFAYREQLQAQETAIDLQYHNHDNQSSASLRQHLASSAVAAKLAGVVPMSASLEQYEAMLSALSRLDGERPSGVDDSLSFLDLQSKSFDERVDVLMSQTVCLPTDRLFLLCGADTEALRQRVLGLVQHGSVYIRGCWVRKSEFRVPCNTVMISVSTNCMRWLRNIIMLSLYHQGFVVSSDIKAEIEGIGSVGHSVKWTFVQDTLKEMCVCGHDRRWRLKYEHMPGFAAAVAAAESAYGEIIAAQRDYIAECGAIVDKQRELFRGGPASDARGAAGGGAMSSPAVHVAEPQLCQLITQVLQQPSVAPRSLAEVAIALNRFGVNTNDEPLLLRALSQTGICCRGRWLRSSVDPSTDACRADVLQLFDAKRVVRSDDIKSVVAKRMQASKANKVMASIMPEFATFQAPSSWVFKGE